MTLLSKDQIIAAQDIMHEDVDVPEWGGVVRVQSFSAKVRSQLVAKFTELKTENGGIDAYSFQVAACGMAIVDEAGNRVFSDDDIKALGQKSSAVIGKIFKIVDKLNAVGDGSVVEKN